MGEWKVVYDGDEASRDFTRLAAEYDLRLDESQGWISDRGDVTTWNWVGSLAGEPYEWGVTLEVWIEDADLPEGVTVD